MAARFFDTIQQIKEDLFDYVKENDLREVKGAVTKAINNATRDINKKIEDDIDWVKHKLESEIQHLEELVEKTFKADLKRAKVYLDQKKREICKLQRKLEKMATEKTGRVKPKTAKKTKKKTSTRKTTTTKRSASTSTNKKSASKKAAGKKDTTVKKKTSKKTAKKATKKTRPQKSVATSKKKTTKRAGRTGRGR